MHHNDLNATTGQTASAYAPPAVSTRRRILSSRWFSPRTLAVLIALAAAVTVVRAARHFNQTYDEGAHIGAGMEWLAHGTYGYDPQHPPLARIAVALGPRLDGARAHTARTVWTEGNMILVGGGDRYMRRLTLARLGILPFFFLLLAVVWAWTRWLYGERAATLAVLLAATMPQLLAHAGLATTDLPLTATLCWALYAFVRWIERAPPSAWRTATFALAGAAAIVSKFSSLPFFALGAVFIVIARWRLDKSHNSSDAGADVRWSWRDIRAYTRPAVAAAVGAGFLVWATYRFHVAIARGFIPVPAPELLAGLRALAAHNRAGHLSYLFGHLSQHGWWYYAPVALVVKAPLAFLALVAIAIGYGVQRARQHHRGWRPLAPYLAAAAVVITAMLGSIDIGVRHLLPAYALLTIPTAGAASALWTREAHRALTRITLAALVAWQVVATASAYPDFLADFNILADPHPDRVLLDSNLDWGQDLQALGDTLTARKITAVSLFYFGTTPVGGVHLADTVRVGGAAPASGWVAVSRMYRAGAGATCYTWLRAYTPVARIGRSMLLYRILPDTVRRIPEGTIPIRSSAESYGAPPGTPFGQEELCRQPRALIHGGGAPLPLDDDTGSLSTSSPATTLPGPPPAPATPTAPRDPAPVTDQMLLGAQTDTREWLVNGHDYTNERYSSLTQINAGTVRNLTVAWVHQLRQPPAEQESSPIVADGVLYYSGPFDMVAAVDARTGIELWRYEYKLSAPVPTCCGPKNRGVAVYGDKVYLATLDDHLIALDRRTGQVLWDVQVADPSVGYSMTSAPLAVDGKIIVGASGSEFPIRGFVDAYEAATGRHVWRFWTIPSPADGGWWGRWVRTTADGDPLPRDIAREHRDSTRYADAWRHGGGGVWNTPSYDPNLHLLFFGIGNPAPNMDASVRPGDNLYTTSIVAVDVETGKLRWYYQEVPHDEWDYDAASPTVLFDVTAGCQHVPAVAQAGKVGWVYILDRRTGARIRRTDPFVPHENTFAAPTPDGVRIMPGMGGGANFAPPSYSPRTGFFYIAGTVEPVLFVLAPQPMEPGVKWQGGRHISLAPVRGTVSAIDVATGKVQWQTWTDPRVLATGSLVTAGDLLFYGEQPGIFKAVDARTGKMLWMIRTGGSLRAAPITYEIDGRQYVAVAAGNALFAFTLQR